MVEEEKKGSVGRPTATCSTSLRSPEPVPVSALNGDDQAQGLNAHFEKMQAMCMRYLMPEPYTDLQGEVAHQAEFARAHRDCLFIGDMIYMLDGPEQREAQHG